jgi:hypothetical protein
VQLDRSSALQKRPQFYTKVTLVAPDRAGYGDTVMRKGVRRNVRDLAEDSACLDAAESFLDALGVPPGYGTVDAQWAARRGR